MLEIILSGIVNYISNSYKCFNHINKQGMSLMKCPRTGTVLKTIKVGGIKVEVSESCGGVFFDNFELDNFKSSKDPRGNALVNHLKQFSKSLPNERERISCPKCSDTVMMRRYYSPLKVIEIDECPGCAGIWLDTGELEKMQDNELSERELALLRAYMVEKNTAPTIDSPKHRFMPTQESSRMEKVLELAMNVVRWY